MNRSNDHKNWITVGEVINLIKKPVAFYTSQIVTKWHAKLRKDCLLFGRCTTPGDCQREKNANNLCHSCNGWYKKLANSHKTGDRRKISWRHNCDTSKWPDDPWEVAKFFMSFLGENKGTVKDGESSDLSSLLNVLEWMKDIAFAPDIRVDRDLVIKLRLEVRNPWAHAPNQEMADADLINAFDIAIKFLDDLDVVFSCDEVKECTKDIQFMQANGISNVVETELKSLRLLRQELGVDVSQMKEELNNLKRDRNSDRQVIEENERKLKKVCRRSELKSRILDKPPIFIGRSEEVKQIISSLVEDDCGIVSIVGGPGFGKSTIAVEVSHHLDNDHDIVVILSWLSNCSTVPEVILRLCRDVGVNPREDPESSLMFWLKNIEKNVVVVMDNIEQLLESKVISEFTELVLTLRKNSCQQLQILTTTRTKFSIPGQTIKNVEIRELDEKSSVELLGKYCSNKEVKDGNLSDLAKLCGHVPLALCIAGSRIPDFYDFSELIHWLKKMPMETLQTSDQSQCVHKAIQFSFQMLSDEDKETLVRLSVFDGNFQRNSAQEVIEKNALKTQNILENLVARSLVRNSSDKRFLIHSLIRRFLTDHNQFQDERATAQGLMVRHFLEVCHSLTVDSYRKDGFTGARESLKKDAHNVEEALKVCSQDPATNLNPNVIDFLASSHIYKSSSRFFYIFSKDLLPQTVLRNFLEVCIILARSRKQLAIEITFQCLVANQEGRKSARKSSEYVERMKDIEEAFDSNREVLKEDRSFFSWCYYFLARSSSKATDTVYPDLPEDDLLPLPASSPLEKAEEVCTPHGRGRLNMVRAFKVYRSDKEKCVEYMNSAKSFYNQALSSAKVLLGDHERTSDCYRSLGDLHSACKKYEEALTYYFDAIKMRKKLQLDSNEDFVVLLTNYGLSLFYCCRDEESVEALKEARDVADKLAERHTCCRATVYYALAKTFKFWKPDCQEAAKYAKVAMEMQELLEQRNETFLKDVIQRAELNLA